MFLAQPLTAPVPHPHVPSPLVTPTSAPAAAVKAASTSYAPQRHSAPTVGATVGTAHDRNTLFRPRMEDEVAVHVCDALPAAFAAVYDGHGGAQVADALSQVLHTVFLEELMAASSLSPSPASRRGKLPKALRPAPAKGGVVELDAVAAFRRAYPRMDRLLAEQRCYRVGATAVTAFLARADDGARVLTVANCGDARAVLARNGRPVRLSCDHRPVGTERTRVEKAGGFVCSGRINGVLNVARAFGDHCMKSLVVSTPDVVEMRLGSMDDFIVLACDGLWDVIDDATVIDIAQLGFDQGLSADEVANVLVKEAIERRSTDNVSVMVVQLHPDDEE